MSRPALNDLRRASEQANDSYMKVLELEKDLAAARQELSRGVLELIGISLAHSEPPDLFSSIMASAEAPAVRLDDSVVPDAAVQDGGE